MTTPTIFDGLEGVTVRRPVLAIIKDLLRFMEENQWCAQRNDSCGCHPKYRPACPECDAFQWADGVHKEGCRLVAQIKEAEALIEYEEGIMAALHFAKDVGPFLDAEGTGDVVLP